MVESASMKLLEAETARDSASEDLSNSSPDGIRKRLLEAQSLRIEAEGASNKAQLTIDSGKEMSELLTQTLDSLTSRADEIQAGMAGREKSVKEWKSSVKEETILLNEKEEERASLLDEHQELENERKELVEERAEVKANANQKASSAINSRSMAEDISRSLAIREQNLADLLVEMAAESVPVADDDAELPNVGDAQKRVNDLRRKLDRYGDFNMLAIEQYDSCKKRLDEMKDDFKVLQERRKRLIDITDKLESQRKTRLLATLKEVNENFKVVYNRLSNGGRGELFLENPDEPFKGGLDMWAQPRGKSNKSRLQGLSGGEKSMASLSLIFAIQDHDPSPFYYFDEVDQNLDVPNSKLIATECRNRSEAAQFIMVTLRKVSLELADHHIGITHGGDGCSRRIVDFDRERAIELGAQAEKEATDAADKNHSRIEEARIIAHEMPEVPDALPAPKSLGGLLNHIEEEESENGFEALTERAEELTEEIEERQKIVSELLADDSEGKEVENQEAEKEV
jgi:chromosome segregation protein